MNSISSFFLAFLAYTPLWLLVAIKDVNAILVGNKQNHIAVWMGLGVITVFWVIGYIWVCLVSRKDFVAWAKPFDSCKIVSCKEQKTVTVGFVVKNVMPMFVFNPTTAEGLALTLSYFLVIASISVRHRHFPANVAIEWLGWTFYECTIEPLNGGDARTENVLSREYLGGANQFRTLMKLNNETFVVAKREEGK